TAGIEGTGSEPHLSHRFLDGRPAGGGAVCRILRRTAHDGLHRNLAVVGGGFGLRDEQLSEAAATIVKSAPDAIISAGPVATRAAQAATKTIPILALSDNMVDEGLVLSLSRPGGNTTGVSLIAFELDGKRQALLDR